MNTPTELFTLTCDARPEKERKRTSMTWHTIAGAHYAEGILGMRFTQ